MGNLIIFIISDIRIIIIRCQTVIFLVMLMI